MSAIQEFVDKLNNLINEYVGLVSTDDLICELNGAIAMVEEESEDRESEK